MPGPRLKNSARRRGNALIAAIIYVLVVSLMVGAACEHAVSHQQRTQTDLRYAGALDMAEAGVNAELRKIGIDASSADPASAPYRAGCGRGWFSVYITGSPFNPGGTEDDGDATLDDDDDNDDSDLSSLDDSTAPGTFTITSTGVMDGVSRTVSVSMRYVPPTQVPGYAVFAAQWVKVKGKGTDIEGNLGTNGFIRSKDAFTVSGSVLLAGQSANWKGDPHGNFNVKTQSAPVWWPTVDDLASRQFPGGLSYLATHNDNSLLGNISGTKLNLDDKDDVVTLQGKPGGANYYLTQLRVTGKATLNFDNTAGPINIWIGPDKSKTSVTLQGGAAAVPLETDPLRAVRIFDAARGKITISGKGRVDAHIYAYNGSSQRGWGAQRGRVIVKDKVDIHGSIVADRITIQGAPTVYATAGLFYQAGGGYYGYLGNWSESGSR